MAQASCLAPMTPELLAVLPHLCAALAIIALLYASVGHAGASGYIAVMSLLTPNSFFTSARMVATGRLSVHFSTGR